MMTEQSDQTVLQSPVQVPEHVTCELMLQTARLCDRALQTSTADDDTAVLFRRLTAAIPGILSLRRIICLCDRCAANPAWWQANRIHLFDPALTYGDIAKFTGLKKHQIRDAIKVVQITEDCYDNLPEIQ